MQFTFETQGSNTFLVYEIGAKESLDSMTMGMVDNNKIEGVIPFQYTQMDSQRLLKYNVSSRVSLAQYFNGVVNKKRLIGVMESLAAAVLNAQDYMLEADSFVWDKEYIFVDVSTAKAELICLPVVRETQESIELELIFKNMFFGVQFDQTENCDYIAKLLGFFNANVHFSLRDFLKLVKELETEKVAGQGAAQPQVAGQPQAGGQPQVSGQQSVQVGEQSQVAGQMGSGQSLAGQQMAGQQSPQGQQAAMQSSGQAGMNSAAASAPAASQQAVPGAQPIQNLPGQTGAQPVKKKVFHLFGKKDKAAKEKAPKESAKKDKAKKEKPAKASKQAQNMGQTNLPGRSTGTVPGMPGANGGGHFVPNQGVAAEAAQSSQSGKQGIGNAYVAPAYNTQQGSFGGTVVLNASNNPGTVVLSAANNPLNSKPVPYLVRVSNGQRIPLNKPVVKIGTDASYADVVIADNKAVSRSHADIRIKDDKVCLVDNNSTNHSYVGNRMIPPNVEEGLVHGSTFRLANEEFELHML